MGDEIRLYGPPGTGKTTKLAGHVAATAKERGTDRIVVGSFTRTAAAEIAGRNLPIPDHQIGTLHSLAYRAIGRPDVAADKIESWNSEHRDLKISGDRRNIDDGTIDTSAGSKLDGDGMLARLDLYRARMVPRSKWDAPTRIFEGLWTNWKQLANVVDYTDMIDVAYQDTLNAPGDPLVGFFDEFQDFTPLEIALVRKWGEQMDRLVIAGDDDQTLYAFKGATPKAFLYPDIPEDHKRFLTQSYRVPRAVQRLAQSWIETVTEREPKDYEPRDEEGLVRYGDKFSFSEADFLVVDVIRQLDAGRTVMVLSSCGYMLDPIRAELRDRGVPFHNPYRRSRGDWNPLGSVGTTAAQRLASYLIIDPDRFPDDYRQWTGADLKAWTHVVKVTGMLVRGAKRSIDMLDDDEVIAYEDLEVLFVDDDVLEGALSANPTWFGDRLTASKSASMAYPLAIARNRPGPELLVTP